LGRYLSRAAAELRGAPSDETVRKALAAQLPPMQALTQRGLFWVREQYRHRFGIESSYRQMHEGQARTTTRRPDVRLLLIGIALLLRNAWVWLHRVLISRELPHGALLMHPEQLRLATLLIHLEHDVILIFGLTDFPLPLSQAGQPVMDRKYVWNY
jgi:hypothetical protein